MKPKLKRPHLEKKTVTKLIKVITQIVHTSKLVIWIIFLLQFDVQRRSACIGVFFVCLFKEYKFRLHLAYAF